MIWVNQSNNAKETYQYYNGEWKDGEPHGFGLHLTEDWKFIGVFKNGIRNGKGI